MAGIDLRLPSITGASDRERIEQLRTYLVYLVGQLQYILGNIDETNLTDTFSRRVTSESGAESVYQQMAEGFSQVVRKNNVISSINQTAEQIEILAQRLNLAGYTSINGGFNVDENGNAVLTGGSDIQLTSASNDEARFSISNEAGTRSVSISPSSVTVQAEGIGSVVIDGEVAGRLTDNPANVYIGASGKLYKIQDDISGTSTAATAPTALYNVSVRDFGGRLEVLPADMATAYSAAVSVDEHVNYTRLVPALLALIQEQDRRIKALEG